jgi:hypothetical protein
VGSDIVDKEIIIRENQTYIILGAPYEPSDALECEIGDFGYILKPVREIVYT